MASTQQIITAAARRRGIDPAALLAIAQLESNYDPNATNPSGATGLFQFMAPTAAQYGLSDRTDPVASSNAAARLARDNGRALQRSLGREPTAGELYLAHQQGLGGARALLSTPNENAVTALTRVYGSAARARAAVTQNGGSPNMTAGQFASLWTRRADEAAGRIPPADLPLDAGRSVAGAASGYVPLPFSGPLTAPKTFAQMPATAMYGQDRLVPGQVTRPPTDFTDQPTGAPDLRALGMVAPPVLPRGLSMAGGALPSIAQMGLGAAGGAAGGVAPAPMPGRPAALTAAPPAAVQAQPPQLPTQRPSAPVAPAPVQLRLASGKTIAPGIYNQGDHSVQVSDAGDGTARITTIHGPGAIPGVMDPLREVNAPTIAGGMIRSMLPKIATDAVTGFAPQVDNARTAAVNAANGLGGALGGFGSGILGGLGGLFGQHPALPHPFNLLGGAIQQQRAPMPMNRPSVFSLPRQQAPQHQTRQQAQNDLRESGMLDQFGMIRM